MLAHLDVAVAGGRWGRGLDVDPACSLARDGQWVQGLGHLREVAPAPVPAAAAPAAAMREEVDEEGKAQHGRGDELTGLGSRGGS